MPWLLHNLFTVLFEKKQLRKYLNKLFFYVVIVFVGCVITYIICMYLPFKSKWTILIVRAIICCIIPNVLYFIVYRKREEFKESMQLFDKMTKGKIPLLKKFY